MSKTIGMFARPFYFLRHGETEANASGIISGSLDVELTALGREQAQAAARTLAGEPITAIYSSPLRRARKTAEPIAQALRLPVRIIPELVERKQGELEGKPRNSYIDGGTTQGSESFEAFTSRVLKGLSQVDNGVPLVVAHQGVYRVICRILEIVRAEGPVENAQPLRFVPLAEGNWKCEAIPLVLRTSV